MDITALPFNRLIGLEYAPPESGFLLSLPASPQYLNHLGTVHASALLALAEASSGEFLLRQFATRSGFVPVVRRLEAKFRKPAHGRLVARGTAQADHLAKLTTDLAAKGRGMVSVVIEVIDESQQVVLSAVVEWFVARVEEFIV